MEIGEIISVSAILVAIIMWNLIIVWQIRSQTSRLVREIGAMGTRLSDVEREHPHQERTHERADLGWDS